MGDNGNNGDILLSPVKESKDGSFNNMIKKSFSKFLGKEDGTRYSVQVTAHTAGNLSRYGIHDGEPVFVSCRRGSKRYGTENAIVENGVAVWNQTFKFTTTLQTLNVSQNNPAIYSPKIFKVQLATDIVFKSKLSSIFSNRSSFIFEAELDISDYTRNSHVIQLLNLEMIPKFSLESGNDLQKPQESVRLHLTLRCVPSHLEQPQNLIPEEPMNNVTETDLSAYTFDSCSDRSFNTICGDALEMDLAKHLNNEEHKHLRPNRSGRFRSFSLSMQLSDKGQRKVLRNDSKEEASIDWCLNRNHLRDSLRPRISNTQEIDSIVLGRNECKDIQE